MSPVTQQRRPMRNLLVLVVAMGTVTVACGRGRVRGDSRARVAPAAHARSEAARWAAVRLPPKRVRQLIGGHVLEAVHQVTSTLDGKPEQTYTDSYHLACRAGGDCQGRLDNSLEYGLEFVRLGEVTWFRHRYQEFLRFTEDREEAERRVAHLWGIGRAVLDLLEPGIRLVPAGQASFAGRSVARYRLARRPGMRPRPAVEGPQAWRARMSVELAEGEVWLDAATGAPLRWTVRYRVSAPKGEHRVTLGGQLKAEVKAPGKDPTITPPARFADAAARRREALDERALLGGYRLNPGWFRGGGPHAARERRRAGGRPAPTGGAPAPTMGAVPSDPRPGAARPAAMSLPARPAMAPAPRPPARQGTP